MFKIIHNITTGEITQEEMTPEEIAESQRLNDYKNQAIYDAQQEAVANGNNQRNKQTSLCLGFY